MACYLNETLHGTMLRPIWIVAFANSRNDWTESSSGKLIYLQERIRQALEEFSRVAAELGGKIELVASVTSAADQIAIDLAQSKEIPVHVIVPLPVSELGLDFRGRPQAWDQTLDTIAKAGGLIGQPTEAVSALIKLGGRTQVTPEWPQSIQPGWTFRVADGTHERDACYHDCAAQMLDAADALLIVLDSDSGYLGGTKDMLHQAEARGIAIAKIELNEPALAREPVAIEWPNGTWTADPVMTELNSVISETKLSQHSSNQIQKIFAVLDEVANQTGGRLKNRVTTMIALQFSATILTLISTTLLLPKMSDDRLANLFRLDASLIGYQIVSGFAFLFLIWAFLLGLASRWTNLKSQWRQTRFAAEVLRSLIHTRGLVDPLYPIISRHRPAWRRLALSAGLAVLRENPIKNFDCEAIKARYHRDRLHDQQEAYYRKQLVSASKWSAVCGVIAFWAGAVAPFFLFLSIYFKLVHWEWVVTNAWSVVFTKFLPVLLPLLAGTAASLKVVTDAGRRAERYQMQAQRLQSINKLFPTLQTPSSIRRSVVLTEEILLDELIEWHAASNGTGK